MTPTHTHRWGGTMTNRRYRNMAKPLILLQRRSLIKNQNMVPNSSKKSLVIAGSRLANLRRVHMRDPLAGAHKEGPQPLSEVRKNAHAANARECTLTGTLFECRAYVLVHLLTRTWSLPRALRLLWHARASRQARHSWLGRRRPNHLCDFCTTPSFTAFWRARALMRLWSARARLNRLDIVGRVEAYSTVLATLAPVLPSQVFWRARVLRRLWRARARD